MNTGSKLRLYAFCNFYMNSISQGIQTAHVVGRMAKFYRKRDGDAANLFWQWLEEGVENETIIVCNGGMGADISDAYYKYENVLTKEGIPSQIFYEESRAFGTNEPAPTCWACVLSEEVYNAKSFPDNLGNQRFFHNGNEGVIAYKKTHQMFDFLMYKNGCGLAK